MSDPDTPHRHECGANRPQPPTNRRAALPAAGGTTARPEDRPPNQSEGGVLRGRGTAAGQSARPPNGATLSTAAEALVARLRLAQVHMQLRHACAIATPLRSSQRCAPSLPLPATASHAPRLARGSECSACGLCRPHAFGPTRKPYSPFQRGRRAVGHLVEVLRGVSAEERASDRVEADDHLVAACSTRSPPDVSGDPQAQGEAASASRPSMLRRARAH